MVMTTYASSTKTIFSTAGRPSGVLTEWRMASITSTATSSRSRLIAPSGGMRAGMRRNQLARKITKMPKATPVSVSRRAAAFLSALRKAHILPEVGRGHRRSIETGAQFRVGRVGEPFPQRLVIRHASQRVGQRGYVSARNQQPGFAIANHLAQSTDIGCNHGCAEAPGLEQHERQALVSRRNHHGVGMRDVGVRSRTEAQQ